MLPPHSLLEEGDTLVSGRSIWFNQKFTLYALGMLFNSLGNALYDLAVPLLIYDLTHSLVLMGTMTVALQLPKLTVGPLAGALVDRSSPRKVMFASYSAQAMLVLLLPLAHRLGILTAWIVIAVSFVTYAVDLFARNASFLLIPILYPNQKVEANAGFATVWTSSMLAGPVIGGLLLSWTTLDTLFVIDAATFALMMACLYLVSVPDSTRTGADGSTTVLTDVLDGLRLSFGTPKLRPFMLSVFLFFLAAAPMKSLAMFSLKDIYRLDNSQAGLTFAAAGLGMLLGTFLSHGLKRWGLERLVIVGMIIATVTRAALALPGWFFLPIALFLDGLGGITYVVGRSAIIQTHCPERLLGRISSLFQMVEQAATPCGIFLAVTLANASSVPVTAAILTLVSVSSLGILWASGCTAPGELGSQLRFQNGKAADC